MRRELQRQIIPLGRVLGIPIGLDYSWFLVFALVTWMLATGYFPHEFLSAQLGYWLTAAATAIFLFLSVVLHELGHSVVARRFAVPVNSITLFIFGGVAQIGAEPPSPRAEFLIALAGPLVSLLLAGLFFIGQFIAGLAHPVLALLRYLMFLNVSLAAFNIIPGFPLDGGRVFRAIVWRVTGSMRRATLIAAGAGRLIAFLFILGGVLEALTGNIAGGLWIAFIGWFLESAAARQAQQQVVQNVLEGHTVSEAMSRTYTAVPAEMTLQDLVDRHVLGSGRRSFVVVRAGEAVGLSTLHQVKEVPKDRWAEVTVVQTMIPVERLRTLRPETALTSAIEAMDREGVNQLPVVADHAIVGLLSREDVISYLRTLQELQA